MTPEEKEKIEDEIHAELKEAAHWYGGWDELRKVIAMLADNDNEAAYERYTSDLSADGPHEITHRMNEYQKLK